MASQTLSVTFSQLGAASTVFYLIAYILTNLAAFGIVTAFGRVAGSDDVKAYYGLSRRAPTLALMMMVAFLSLAGMPPFGGFVAKVFVFAAAIEQGWVWLAVVGVLIGIELARRVVGNVFVIMGVLLLLYGIYGDYAPDLFAHAGDTFPGVCTSIFYKSDGVFGIMANVLATYVLLFVIFGAFLEKSGAQKFFIDFPLAAVGHKIGGPAKVSVIASGLFGSISGSAIANTVSTGTLESEQVITVA